MKRLFVLFGILFCITAFAQTVDWYVDGQIYQTTTCSSGDSITVPNAPAKYGYTFKKWHNMSFGTIVTTSTSPTGAKIMVTHDGAQQEIVHTIGNTPVYIDDVLKIWYPYQWTVENISSHTIKIGSTILNPSERITWVFGTVVNYDVLILD